MEGSQLYGENHRTALRKLSSLQKLHTSSSAVCRDMWSWAPGIGCDLPVLLSLHGLSTHLHRLLSNSVPLDTVFFVCALCSPSTPYYYYLLNYLITSTVTRKWKIKPFSFAFVRSVGCPQVFWHMAASPLPLLKLQKVLTGEHGAGAIWGQYCYYIVLLHSSR